MGESTGVASGYADAQELYAIAAELERLRSEAVVLFGRFRALTYVEWRSVAATAFQDEVTQYSSVRGLEVDSYLDQAAQDVRYSASAALTGGGS